MKGAAALSIVCHTSLQLELEIVKIITKKNYSNLLSSVFEQLKQHAKTTKPYHEIPKQLSTSFQFAFLSFRKDLEEVLRSDSEQFQAAEGEGFTSSSW